MAASSQHIFIVSSSPNDKLDNATEYHRRAHAARQSRKGARKPTKSRNITTVQAAPPGPSKADQPLLGSGFLALPNLDEDLSRSIVELVAFTHTLQTLSVAEPLSASQLHAHMDTRCRLQSLRTQANGLAFLKPPDVIYEACRFAAMLYCDVLATAPPVITAAARDAGSVAPLPRIRGVTRLDLVDPRHYDLDKGTGNSSGNGNANFVVSVSYRLRFVLESLFAGAVWAQYPDLMVWATVMGAIAAQQPHEREWYAHMLRIRCVPLVSLWEEVRRILVSYLWDTRLLDEKGAKLWNDTTR